MLRPDLFFSSPVQQNKSKLSCLHAPGQSLGFVDSAQPTRLICLPQAGVNPRQKIIHRRPRTGQLQRLAKPTKKISGEAVVGLLQPCVVQGR